VNLPVQTAAYYTVNYNITNVIITSQQQAYCNAIQYIKFCIFCGNWIRSTRVGI